MNSFNPVLYSTEENQFLLENVGLPPIVALNKPIPQGVNSRAVRPILQEVFDREQLRTISRVEWLGVEKLSQAIKTWLTMDAKWALEHQRTRGRVPRNPSMYVQDGKGKYHLSASGADSNMPRTFVDADGNRHLFEVPLDGDLDETFNEIVSKEAPKSVIDDKVNRRIECPICQHTESYKTESRQSYNLARSRMSKHLKKATDETSLHRELYTNEFGS